MKKMQVAMYYNNNDVRIEKLPIPEIDDNEMLVKVKASGICGSDVMEWYRIKKAPLVLGHEIAGDIVEVGKNVGKYKVGDKVFVSHHVPCNACRYCLNGQHTLCGTLHSTNFYPGGFAGYLRVPKINVDRGTFVLPKEMTYDEGVFIEPLACVVRGMRIAEMKPKKTVNISEQLKKHNDGRLADFVFLCTGALPAIRQAIDSVNRGGTLMFFAPTEPGVDVPFPLFDLWNKGVKMVSTYAGAPRDITDAIELISSKKVKVNDMISHKLSLSEAAKGFRLVAEAKESVKVILEP
jgi:L-iditol 2-dehydrogenase